MIKKVTFIALGMLSVQSVLSTWENPDSLTKSSYIYAPGVLVSEILMGRYCPEFTASTGELITCSKGIEVINLPASSSNFAEITLKSLKQKPHTKRKGARRGSKEKNYPTKKESIWIRAVLAPLRGLWHVLSYIGNRTLLGCSFMSKSSTDKSLSTYSVDPRRINLAQEEDLAILHALYANHLAMAQKEYPDLQHSIVLYGTSRGSAAVFNFYALYHPKEVKAVVCEALFDSIAHIHEVTRSGLIRFQIKMLRKLSSFKDDGILPIHLVASMPHDIPILLITSLKDQTVPCECTMNIYQKLRQAGHNKVHILVLEKAVHVNYPCCNKRDRDLYEHVVHAFYKHYGLPYIPEFAQKGAEHFATQTQPVVENHDFVEKLKISSMTQPDKRTDKRLRRVHKRTGSCT